MAEESKEERDVTHSYQLLAIRRIVATHEKSLEASSYLLIIFMGKVGGIALV